MARVRAGEIERWVDISDKHELANRAQARETEALPQTDDIDPRLAVAAGTLAHSTTPDSDPGELAMSFWATCR
jgi:hypothetical protein